MATTEKKLVSLLLIAVFSLTLATSLALAQEPSEQFRPRRLFFREILEQNPELLEQWEDLRTESKIPLFQDREERGFWGGKHVGPCRGGGHRGQRGPRCAWCQRDFPQDDSVPRGAGRFRRFIYSKNWD